jgi:glycosyltransferase involved in cell wall biosynthesis
MSVQTIKDETAANGAMPAPRPRISIVIPLYNEEESIPHLYEALDPAIANYGQPAEVIIIDDGSRDRSFALLSEIAAARPALHHHPLPPQLRADGRLCRRLCPGARRGGDHDGRRPAERPDGHSAADGQDRRGLSTSSAAGARTARIASSTASCRR